MSHPHAQRLADLRAELARRGLAGFVVPLTDEHGSEYVADYAQRLMWISGFKGSAGSAIILADKAAVFVDGRYVIQVRDQVDGALFERVHLDGSSAFDWLAPRLKAGDRIGYDPRLHTPGWVEEARQLLSRKRAELVALSDNPIDSVWSDQPAPPPYPLRPHETALAGESAAKKRARLAAVLAEKGADAAVLTALDSIAWLFNVRGNDVDHTPVALSYALLHQNGQADLYIDEGKLDDDVRVHLGNEVSIKPYDSFYGSLGELGAGGRAVLADPATANAAVFEALKAGGAEIIHAADPCALPKACKNAAEIGGSVAAHLRDGAAVTNFLHWLDEEAPKGGLTEIGCVEKLLSFRQTIEGFRDTSFDTISGAGPNGAICHYRVSPESSRPLKAGELYLVDSGGQYPDGTTDITRTVPIGTVGDEERDRFTRVLKGHIALACARFPKGTTGAQLDAIARKPLWDAGLDYDHGTGHGVGSYLAVHEGPQRISKAPNAIALQPGMILSNEPGYYKDGGYGIRIENLVHVVADENEAERPFLRFETLTLAPIDRRLVKIDLLDADERAWLDGYHARVHQALAPLVDAGTRPWLAAMTAPLGA
ncbi:Xaa-Pro aminopeptidase [Iodidimonas nitroreducens]|uniref:Xaa-Pro aminopeptidase n=1 Tax=Iodidimonas nitroreducens TaxID=1236968 RepID=A0A5A7NCU5_9PROT|nr:aminopeptidase P family protein [Iodidimonas nitroreducens]GAK34515.1 putative Xaa-Pro aminopeptidase P [alpha proteobacterium Q-1]GER05445.1 Xaa-Pro aminopeptidase [Iodidimonas nitroreducens]